MGVLGALCVEEIPLNLLVCEEADIKKKDDKTLEASL